MFSCSGHFQNGPLLVLPNAVFTEYESFLSDGGRQIHWKHDYFIVKGDLSDKQKLRNELDTFATKIVNKEIKLYDTYLIFFYKESSEVNEEKIRNVQEGSRWKIFLWAREDDGIVTYSFEKLKLFDAKWNSKYE
ncbi:MAG TPA: hypothetical protein VGZ71_07905 [Puia sp.]|nr:hypothetical protein [Puia sp.]